jgi:hypothetical protein
MEFSSPPEEGAPINLSSEAHRLSRFLLVNTLETLFTHSSIEVILVMVCLYLLKTDDIRRSIDDLSHNIMESA